MSEDKDIPLKNPGAPTPAAEALTELLREGAQRMLAAAIKAEVADFLERFKDEKAADGGQRVVRNGHLPARSIQTGVGSVEVTAPRARDLREDDPVYLGHSPAVPSADPKPRRTAALDVPERDLDR